MPAKAELKGKVSLDPRDFKRRLNTVRRTVKDFGSVAASAFKGAAAAGGLVVASMAVMLKAASDYGDTMDKMSRKTGISTQALAGWKHAAEQGGGSVANLDKALGRMAYSITEAVNGTKTYADAIKDLGLDITELKDLSPEQQFEKMAMAIASIKDPTKRAAMAMKLLGRSGRELLPMLDQGADGLKKMRDEAQRLGLVITPEQAASAAQFKDEIDNLKKAFLGLMVQGSDFGPFIKLLQDATKFLVDFRETGAFKALGTEIAQAAGQLLGFNGNADSLADAVFKIAEGLKSMRQNGDFTTIRDTLVGVAKVLATIISLIQKAYEYTPGMALFKKYQDNKMDSYNQAATPEEIADKKRQVESQYGADSGRYVSGGARMRERLQDITGYNQRQKDDPNTKKTAKNTKDIVKEVQKLNNRSNTNGPNPL